MLLCVEMGLEDREDEVIFLKKVFPHLLLHFQNMIYYFFLKTCRKTY